MNQRDAKLPEGIDYEVPDSGGRKQSSGSLGHGPLSAVQSRMVQARTRIMNQLQAVALNEGLRCKKSLWRDAGRDQLESFA